MARDFIIGRRDVAVGILDFEDIAEFPVARLTVAKHLSGTPLLVSFASL